jgi:NADP-dependent 3-hydroxy acid dehydrogenase YdfG
MADRTTRNVMITGASTGIGKACALHLEKLGFKVFAGVRQKADGLELVEEGCGEIQPVILDVTDPACIASAAQEV